MFASFTGDLSNFSPDRLFPNTKQLSHPALRIIGPLTKQDQEYYDDRSKTLERIWASAVTTPKEPPFKLSPQKEGLCNEEIHKTKTAYQLFLSQPKTAAAYEDYFNHLDRLEELTRPSCVIRDLRLATHISIYLEAKKMLENQSQSVFDGKALTDSDLMERARTFVSCLDILPIKLQEGTTRLGEYLFTLYDQFGRFCVAGAAHAARIDPTSNFALAKTHRNSIDLFTNALLSLIQKNSSSEKTILESLENREERYLSLLPVLALYHLSYTKGTVPEIFLPITEELSSLSVTEAELRSLHRQLLETTEGTASEIQKKLTALLSKLPTKEKQHLTGIMRAAIAEVIKTRPATVTTGCFTS